MVKNDLNIIKDVSGFKMAPVLNAVLICDLMNVFHDIFSMYFIAATAYLISVFLLKHSLNVCIMTFAALHLNYKMTNMELKN